jgi:cyclopropane-fatty-acyl-phospholipid synthase
MAEQAPIQRSEVIAPVKTRHRLGWRTPIERRVLRGVARRVDRLEIVEELGSTPRPLDVPVVEAAAGPIVLRVLDRRAYSAVASEGSAGLGEAYFRGWWETDDLVGALRAMVRAQEGLDRRRSAWHRLARPVLEPVRRLRRPDAERDRRNVRAHYDLSDDFFELFLDETLTYSSAVFVDPSADLAAASEAKLARLCDKLAIAAGTRVLEIGTGWGSFALHAARRGATVTTTTVSANQAARARRRVDEAGLAGSIEVAEADYRDLEGTYPVVASIEMIEAVDWRDLPGYFDVLAARVAPDGLVGLQAIVVADERHDRVRVTKDFIKTWVFPGGNLPSITEMVTLGGQRGLRLIDLEDLGAHYAETLHRWRDALRQRAADLGLVGASQELGRLWDFYFAYCEAAFLERHISVVQAVFASREWRGDLRLRPA